MKPLRILTFLMALSALFAIAAQADEHEQLADALAQAKTENKMVVIDFYTDW